MTVNELREALAQSLGDPTMEMANEEQLLMFINQAARDAGNEDWVLPIEEDESLVLATATYDYAVPAGFKFIHEIRLEGSTSDLYDSRIADYKWRLVLDSSSPKIRFESRLFTITDGRQIKLVGQKRPTTYTSGSTTVDTGLESFLHERATWYGARYLATRKPEMASSYNATAQQARAASDLLSQKQREHMGRHRYARAVPGR